MARGVTCELETDYYFARRAYIHHRAPSSKHTATHTHTHRHFIVKIMGFRKGKHNFPHRRLRRTFLSLPYLTSTSPKNPSNDMSIKFLRKFSCLHLCNLLSLIISKEIERGGERGFDCRTFKLALFDSNYSETLARVEAGFVN